MSGQPTPFDMKQLESVVLKVLRENPDIVKAAITDMIGPVEQTVTTETAEQRRERMRKLIAKDFDQYDETFKALA